MLIAIESCGFKHLVSVPVQIPGILPVPNDPGIFYEVAGLLDRLKSKPEVPDHWQVDFAVLWGKPTLSWCAQVEQQ